MIFAVVNAASLIIHRTSFQCFLRSLWVTVCTSLSVVRGRYERDSWVHVPRDNNDDTNDHNRLTRNLEISCHANRDVCHVFKERVEFRVFYTGKLNFPASHLAKQEIETLNIAVLGVFSCPGGRPACDCHQDPFSMMAPTPEARDTAPIVTRQ